MLRTPTHQSPGRMKLCGPISIAKMWISGAPKIGSSFQFWCLISLRKFLLSVVKTTPAESARNDFLKELADLAEGRPPAALKRKLENGEEEVTNFSFERERCKIILSLREDYLSELEDLRDSMRSVMRNRLRIRRMNGENAFKVVVKPGPGLVDDEVATHLVQLVARSRAPAQSGTLSENRLEELEVEPALLSLVCRELNAMRITNKQPKITIDLLRGSYHDILKRFYDESLANLPPEVRFFIEDRLLTRSGFRTSVALEDALAQKAMTQEIIDRLVKRRLLRIEDRLNVTSVELTHDILTTVIRESRDARQKQAADAALAAERERAEREKQAAAATLYAERERAGREKQQAADALAAEQARVEREKKRTRLALAALFVALVSMAVAAGFRISARKAKEKAHGFSNIAVEMIGQIIFEVRDALQPIGRLKVIERTIETATKDLDNFQGTDATDDILYDKAVARATYGDILSDEGEVGKALEEYTKSLAIFRSLNQSTPTGLYRFAITTGCSRLAMTKCAQADLEGGIALYQEAVDILQQLVREKEAQESWSNTLAADRDSLADGLQAQGKLDKALILYQQSLEERKKRATDLGNDQEQGKDAQKDKNAGQGIDDGAKIEFSQSYVSIGDALRALGQLSQALKYQQDGLAFREQLAEADPSDVSRQHDLSQSYDRVGEALQDSGQLKEAHEAFLKSEYIFDKLYEQDPSNVDWTRNFTVTLMRLADVTTVIGETGRTAEIYRLILKLRQELANIDKSNADAKDDLSEACLRVGDSLLVQGHLKASEENYEKAFALRSETAKKDSTNLDRQELLAESHEKMGDILFARGNLDNASKHYEESRGIRQTLADKDRSNTLRRSDLATSIEKLGDANSERGDIVSALGWFQKAAKIQKALVEKDPSNAKWKADLAIGYRKLAEVDVAQKDLSAAFEHFQQSLDTLEELARLAPENSEWQAGLCDTRTAFAKARQSNRNSTEARELLLPVVGLRENLVKLDETNVKRQSELARALYLSATMLPEAVESNATTQAILKRAKDIMQGLRAKPELELTAEQQRWLKEIEQAK